VATPPDLGAWFFAVYIIRFAALAAAIVLARRRSQYALIAWFLGLVTAADMLRTGRLLLVLGERPPGSPPYAGLDRVAFHVGEQAPFIALPFAVAALAIHVLTKRRAWPIALAYVAVVAVLVIGYPLGLRRELLQSFYLGVTLAALAVSLGAVAVWWRATTPTTPPERAALLMVAAQGATIAAPYALGLIDVTWPAAQGIYVAIYGVLFALEVAWIRRS
jgi:hypothetical protein